MRGTLLLFWWSMMSMVFAYAGEKKEIFIYSWANYIPTEVLKAFEKETGIRVIYDVFDSIEMLETRLSTSSGYDVVFPPLLPVYVRSLLARLFLPLDGRQLPHATGLDPQLLERLKKVNGEALTYGVPYLWGTTGLGYDENAVQKRLGEENPEILQSWALVFDPHLAKKLSPGRITFLDTPLDVLQAALLYLGKDPCTLDIKEWQEAIAVVRKVRPFIAAFESTRQIENLVQGQSEILQGFSTYVHMARRQAPGKKIVYLIPKEGSMLWVDMIAIPKDAPHPRNAHLFINFLLKPEVMAKISNVIRAANPVPASYPWLDPELRKDPTIFPDEKTMARIYPDCLLGPKLMRYLFHEWLKLKMGYNRFSNPSCPSLP